MCGEAVVSVRSAEPMGEAGGGEGPAGAGGRVARGPGKCRMTHRCEPVPDSEVPGRLGSVKTQENVDSLRGRQQVKRLISLTF